MAVSPTGRLVARWAALDRVERKFFYAGASVPLNVAMALWKLALVIVAPSAFMLSNLVYTLGVAAAKVVAIRARVVGGHEQRVYRSVGWIVLGLSLTYVASCLLTLLFGGHTERYDGPVAVVIAAVAFGELVFSFVGLLWARRHQQLLVEAIRLAGLAGSLVLVVLTQAAILSFTYDGDARVPNSVAGIVFGSVAVFIGASMVLRRLR